MTYNLDANNRQGPDVTFAILQRSGFRVTHRGACVVANWGNFFRKVAGPGGASLGQVCGEGGGRRIGRPAARHA